MAAVTRRRRTMKKRVKRKTMKPKYGKKVMRSIRRKSLQKRRRRKTNRRKKRGGLGVPSLPSFNSKKKEGNHKSIRINLSKGILENITQNDINNYICKYDLFVNSESKIKINEKDIKQENDFQMENEKPKFEEENQMNDFQDAIKLRRQIAGILRVVIDSRFKGNITSFMQKNQFVIVKQTDETNYVVFNKSTKTTYENKLEKMYQQVIDSALEKLVSVEHIDKLDYKSITQPGIGGGNLTKSILLAMALRDREKDENNMKKNIGIIEEKINP